MKLDRKNLMIIGGVLLAVGIGVYLWRRKKSQEEDIIDTDYDDVTDDVTDEELQKSAGESSSSSDKTSSTTTSSPTTSQDPRYSYPVNPLLSKIKNKKVASYLSKLLSQEDIYRFRGWMDLINKERAKDPTKWGDANGLKGEVARVGGALYQMNEQNQKTPSKTIRNKIKAKRKLWSTKILTDLRDAQ
jgi:LPXTG-motif cell wall-anchored protein